MVSETTAPQSHISLNTENKIWMVCYQKLPPQNFIKTQKITCKCYTIKNYRPRIYLKHKNQGTHAWYVIRNLHPSKQKK